MISFGRNDEPTSCQVYLSTSPRKNLPRSVPFSRMISARCANSCIAHHQAAAFAGDDVLGFVKTETAEIADRAERAVLVTGHDALRGVFDDLQTMTPGDGRDRIHFAGDAGVMHRNDRAGPRRDRVLDQPFIEIERVLPDIDEHRHRAAQHEGVGGRHEGVGRQDDLVAAFQVEQQRGHVQRGRAGMRQQCLGAAGSLLDPLMTALGERPVAGKMIVALRLGRIDHLLAGGVRSVERDVICCHCFTSVLAGALAPRFERAQIGGFRRGNQRLISAGHGGADACRRTLDILLPD